MSTEVWKKTGEHKDVGRKMSVIVKSQLEKRMAFQSTSGYQE